MRAGGIVVALGEMDRPADPLALDQGGERGAAFGAGVADLVRLAGDRL